MNVADIALGALAAGAGTVLLAVDVIGWRFASLYWRRRQPAPPPAGRKIAVILSLRGSDSSLERCLRGLLDQDHADFDLQMCLDHPSDPAGETVERIVAGRRESEPRVHVSHLRRPCGTCSLKVSAHLQSLAQIADFDCAAFVDADADVSSQLAACSWPRSRIRR